MDHTVRHHLNPTHVYFSVRVHNSKFTYRPFVIYHSGVLQHQITDCLNTSKRFLEGKTTLLRSTCHRNREYQISISQKLKLTSSWKSKLCSILVFKSRRSQTPSCWPPCSAMVGAFTTMFLAYCWNWSLW